MNENEDQTIDPLASMSREDFVAQVNTEFRFLQDGAWLPGRLIEVSGRRIHSRQDCFSLLFELPLGFVPVQGIYPFDHEILGSANIFLVPVEKTDEALLFEAVFNRLIKQA